MSQNNTDICRQVNKREWAYPALLGVCGGLLGTFSSNLGIGGQFLIQAIYWTIGYKIVLILTGAGMGWKIGNSFYDPGKAIEQLISEPEIWKLIKQNYKPNDEPMLYKKGLVIPTLLDTSLDIGKLYTFCSFIFIERYENMESEEQVMREFKYMVHVLTAKHPMLKDSEPVTLMNIIERRVIEDLYPYIYSYYLITNKNSQKKLDPLLAKTLSTDKIPLVAINNYDNIIKLILSETNSQVNNIRDKIECILISASNIFRQLPEAKHPQDKAKLLIKMTKLISDRLAEYNIIVSADLLIPIVSNLIIQNIDIVPGAEIKMAYDYLGHLANEDAYVVTVLLSSLTACIEGKVIR